MRSSFAKIFVMLALGASCKKADKCSDAPTGNSSGQSSNVCADTNTETLTQGTPYTPASPVMQESSDTGTATSSSTETSTAAEPQTVTNRLSLKSVADYAQVGHAVQLSVSGGAGPFVYRTSLGTISASGVLTSPTSGSALVSVTDSVGNLATSSVVLYDPISITPSKTVLAINNSLTLALAGGIPPYTVTASAGSVTGNQVYVAPSSPQSVQLTVSDTIGNQGIVHVAVNAALQISPTSGSIFASSTISFSSSGGTGGVTYSVYSGSGTISGLTYSAPTTSQTVVVRATDSYGNTSDSQIKVIIHGDLDSSFGTAGSITISTGAVVASFTDSVGSVIASGSDIIVAGSTDRNGGKFFLAKYLTDGTLDSSFGTAGMTLIQRNISVGSVIPLSGGKYFLGGTVVHDFQTGNDFELARFNANGSLDSTYGANGISTVYGGSQSWLTSVTVLSTGKILLVGSAPNSFAINFARLDTSGVLDNSFGTNNSGYEGAVTCLNYAPVSTHLLAGDKFLVFGWCTSGTPNARLYRFTSNGQIDSTFGTNGYISIPGGALGSTMLSDGKILAYGGNSGTPYIRKFLSDGSPDTSFGSGGLVSGGLFAYKIVELPFGKLLIGGGNMKMRQLNQDGSIDTSFGVSGDTNGISQVTAGSSLVLLPDGKVLQVGSLFHSSGGPSYTEAIIARFIP